MNSKLKIAKLQQELELKLDYIKEYSDFLYSRLIISVRHNVGESEGFTDKLVNELLKFGTVGRASKPSPQKKRNFLVKLIQDDMSDNWPAEKLLTLFKEVVYVNLCLKSKI